MGGRVRRRALAALAAVTLAAGLGMAAPASAAPPPKVTVCHLDDVTGEWKALSISEKALSAHLAHGDGQPGSAVPAQEGWTFGDACAPVPPTWPLVLTDVNCTALAPPSFYPWVVEFWIRNLSHDETGGVLQVSNASQSWPGVILPPGISGPFETEVAMDTSKVTLNDEVIGQIACP